MLHISRTREQEDCHSYYLPPWKTAKVRIISSCKEVECLILSPGNCIVVGVPPHSDDTRKRCGFAIMHTHTCTPTHVHPHMHTYTCTPTHAHLHMHTRTCTPTHVHPHMYTCTPIHAHPHMYTHACTPTHAHLHMHTYTCTPTHAHTHVHPHMYTMSITT